MRPPPRSASLERSGAAMANDSVLPEGEVRLGPVMLPAGRRIFTGGNTDGDRLLWAPSSSG
jgi:hypothetical protein